jgi:SAM-dependent methyltransferase
LGQGARKVNLPKNALDRNPRGARGSTVPDLDRKRHYSQPETVEFYTTAAVEVGLWRSEEALFRRVFAPGEILLNVGCGAGRVSLALWELGYPQVVGVDFARPMVEAARLLASKLEYAAPFRVGDVTCLTFDAGSFDGAIWSAAGMADVVEPASQVMAMNALRRVVRNGGRAIVTTPTTGGWTDDGVRALFRSTGWSIADMIARPALADEPEEVTRRYPDVNFWVLAAD